MEISSAEDKQRELFLHLVHVGDTQELKDMAPSQRVDEDRRWGSEFQTRKTTVRVLFNRQGKVGGRIRITEGGKVLVDRPLTLAVMSQNGLAMTP